MFQNPTQDPTLHLIVFFPWFSAICNCSSVFVFWEHWRVLIHYFAECLMCLMIGLRTCILSKKTTEMAPCLFTVCHITGLVICHTWWCWLWEPDIRGCCWAFSLYKRKLDEEHDICIVLKFLPQTILLAKGGEKKIIKWENKAAHLTGWSDSYYQWRTDGITCLQVWYSKKDTISVVFWPRMHKLSLIMRKHQTTENEDCPVL